MSTFPGFTLEEAIEDNFNVSQGDWFSVLCIFFNPYKKIIEQRLNNFEEETQSWRDQRPGVWYGIPEIPLALKENLHRLKEFKRISDCITRIIPHDASCKYVDVETKCTCWKETFMKHWTKVYLEDSILYVTPKLEV